MMFMASDRIAEDLALRFTWGVLRAPPGHEFVLPDSGVSIVDPTPPHPFSGAAFRSSPNAETIMVADPTFVLALVPGPPDWHDKTIEASLVEDFNLRSYAWSDAAYYGRSQKVVADMRALAKRQGARVARYEPNPGRIWITEGEGPEAGEHEFIGYAADGSEVRQRFFVHPEALKGSKPYTGD